MKIKVFHLKKNNKLLSTNHLRKILKLKNKFWNFGLESQMNWYLKNVKKDDLHIMGFLKNKKKLCSYTLLRKRNLIYRNKKKNFFYLDTFISEKQNNNIFNLMKFIKKCIGKKICILICEKKFEKLYYFFNFKKLNKKRFNLVDHSLGKKILMIYNNENFKSKINIYINK